MVTVGFVLSEYTASEGDSSVAMEIRRSGSSEVPLTVYVSTSDESAASGEDYVGIQRMAVVLSPLSEAAEVRVDIVNDEVVERDEQFRVSLESSSSLSRVVIGQATAVVNLQDDDCKFDTDKLADLQMIPSFLYWSCTYRYVNHTNILLRSISYSLNVQIL